MATNATNDAALNNTTEEKFGIIACISFGGRMRAFVHQFAPLDAAALRKLSADALTAADCIAKADRDNAAIYAERDAARKRGRR